jgi:hypothetical protein
VKGNNVSKLSGITVTPIFKVLVVKNVEQAKKLWCSIKNAVHPLTTTAETEAYATSTWIIGLC